MDTRALLVLSVSMLGAMPFPAHKRPSPPASAVPQAHESPGAVQSTTGDVEHGRYLVERVAMCGECHSGRDPAGNVLPQERFMGGPIPFQPPWSNDWASRAPRNRGLVGYTDEMAIRLLTEGAIGRDGVQLKPPMPRFRMSRQDAAAVIAYMRSIN